MAVKQTKPPGTAWQQTKGFRGYSHASRRYSNGCASDCLWRYRSCTVCVLSETQNDPLWPMRQPSKNKLMVPWCVALSDVSFTVVLQSLQSCLLPCLHASKKRFDVIRTHHLHNTVHQHFNSSFSSLNHVLSTHKHFNITFFSSTWPTTTLKHFNTSFSQTDPSTNISRAISFVFSFRIVINVFENFAHKILNVCQKTGMFPPMAQDAALKNYILLAFK